jgi:hypothetical protein
MPPAPALASSVASLRPRDGLGFAEGGQPRRVGVAPDEIGGRVLLGAVTEPPAPILEPARQLDAKFSARDAERRKLRGGRRDGGEHQGQREKP